MNLEAPKEPVQSQPDQGVPAASPHDWEVETDGPEAQESPAEAQPAFPVVGIGASAGGLAAFEAFFAGMPTGTDPGMAFVLVQHLAPDHKSILSELIRRYTRMQVFDVEDGMLVRPNCVYIISPNRDMAFFNGALHLLEPVSPRGQRLPVDFFLRSLAQDQHERAIGVVLSGTGSDGTLGVRAIKGGGGMVMAQTPESTEYDGMPRNVIATGLVDYELPPAEMAAQIIAYVSHAFSKSDAATIRSLPKNENAMNKVFILLRAQTGNDFSGYKPSTIHRRIQRRMAVHRISNLEDYVKFLQQTSTEVESLFRDLLIGVTSFFRDPEAFQALADHIIPRIFKAKPSHAVIRVWVAGCSTGEEVYSIAILLAEQMEVLKQTRKVQVFATDIDSQALATARDGIYPASIATDISPERLARFFVANATGENYRIHKKIREMLIFSEQNVIKDPPFSKLDLISCRNLMIYLDRDLQKMLIPMFHYALSPGGMLFLGTSETAGESADLFDTLERKAKIYLRKENFRRAGHIALSGLLRSKPELAVTSSVFLPAPAEKLCLRELTERTLLRHLHTCSVLVNGQGDIFYVHGRSGMYLEPAQGETGTSNILKMAREGLRHELLLALRKVPGSSNPVIYPGLRVKTNGHFTLVNLRVVAVEGTPAAAVEDGFYLVILKQESVVEKEPVYGTAEYQPDIKTRVEELTRELRAKEEYLQSTNEELETSNEELKSSNEELQSVNEEMQSTNEELETTKEEFQSLNEELATVNTELQNKVVDLSRTNNDMCNLLSGTGIATVFVDYKLRIMRFTPGANAIINLIPGDVGRPVGHLVYNLLGYDSLVDDIQAVLSTLIPREISVQTRGGAWFTMRILPYRTLEIVIEGAVVTFVDISETRKAQDDLLKANDLLRLAVVVRDAHDAITVQNLEGRIIAWNPGAVRLYGWSEVEALAMNVRDRIPKGLRKGAIVMLHHLSQAQVIEPYRTQRLAKDGTSVAVSIISTALVNEDGDVYAIATTERAEAIEIQIPPGNEP